MLSNPRLKWKNKKELIAHEATKTAKATRKQVSRCSSLCWQPERGKENTTNRNALQLMTTEANVQVCWLSPCLINVSFQLMGEGWRRGGRRTRPACRQGQLNRVDSVKLNVASRLHTEVCFLVRLKHLIALLIFIYSFIFLWKWNSWD